MLGNCSTIELHPQSCLPSFLIRNLIMLSLILYISNVTLSLAAFFIFRCFDSWCGSLGFSYLASNLWNHHSLFLPISSLFNFGNVTRHVGLLDLVFYRCIRLCSRFFLSIPLTWFQLFYVQVHWFILIPACYLLSSEFFISVIVLFSSRISLVPFSFLFYWQSSLLAFWAYLELLFKIFISTKLAMRDGFINFLIKGPYFN